MQQASTILVFDTPGRGFTEITRDVADWLAGSLNRNYGAPRLERREGLVQVAGLDYDRIDDAYELAPETRWCIGWINQP